MKNKPFRILIYFMLPIFCLFCASKNKEVQTNENNFNELQDQIDDLEYIVKNNPTGDDFSNEKLSMQDMEANATDNATSIQVLKAKINYLEKELENNINFIAFLGWNPGDENELQIKYCL